METLTQIIQNLNEEQLKKAIFQIKDQNYHEIIEDIYLKQDFRFARDRKSVIESILCEGAFRYAINPITGQIK